jgi:hypothetical protein
MCGIVRFEIENSTSARHFSKLQSDILSLHLQKRRYGKTSFTFTGNVVLRRLRICYWYGNMFFETRTKYVRRQKLIAKLILKISSDEFTVDTQLSLIMYL